MKHLPPSPSRHRLAVLAAAFGLAVLATPAAHAFTIDNQSNTNSDGSARYTDPDARFSGSGTARPRSSRATPPSGSAASRTRSTSATIPTGCSIRSAGRTRTAEAISIFHR